MWTGEKSVELGLADALGSTEFVAREVFKAEKLVNFTPEENVFERLSKSFGAERATTLGRAAAGSGTFSSADALKNA